MSGNLTKHILKHHKKEQNAYIGKDDIIIKKGKKSVKDPVAVDFLEKSMLVLPENTREAPGTPPTSTPTSAASAAMQLFTMAQIAHQHSQAPLSTTASDWAPSDGDREADADKAMEQEQTSSGSEAGCTLRISTSPEPPKPDVGALKRPFPDSQPPPSTETSPRTDTPSSTHQSMHQPAHLAGTKCSHCGKCFRKPTALQVHVSLKHPAVAEPVVSASAVGELREVRSTLSASAELLNGGPSLDATLTSLDQRVARLERQVESSLGSLASLVQLQGGMNAAFTRFRDEVTGQLKGLQGILLSSSSAPSAPQVRPFPSPSPFPLSTVSSN